MKNVLLIFLALQLGTMSFLEHGLLGELFKLEELVSHYVNDHSEPENIFEFVYNHYWGQASNEMDHAAFPFQNTHMHTYNFWFPIQVVDVPEMNLFSQSQEWHLQQHILLDMFESKGIWQPPGA